MTSSDLISIDPAATQAVLFGVSQYPKDPESLDPLPAVVANLSGLVEVLTDESICGIPPEGVACFEDESDERRFLEEVIRRGKEAQSTLIVYYAGHGIPKDDQLYLATTETTWAEADINGFSFRKLRNAMRRSRARTKILILDCCFSGKALQHVADMGVAGDLLVQHASEVRGTFAMTSASATTTAKAPVGSEHTAFTGELLSVLQKGLETAGPILTLDQVFNAVLQRLEDEEFPTPQVANFGQADQFRFAHNRFLLADPPRLIEMLRTRLHEAEERLIRAESEIAEQDGKIAELENQVARSDQDPGRLYRSLSGDEASALPITHPRVFTAPRVFAAIVTSLIVVMSALHFYFLETGTESYNPEDAMKAAVIDVIFVLLPLALMYLAMSQFGRNVLAISDYPKVWLVRALLLSYVGWLVVVLVVQESTIQRLLD